jgi:hypothetical protein
MVRFGNELKFGLEGDTLGARCMVAATVGWAGVRAAAGDRGTEAGLASCFESLLATSLFTSPTLVSTSRLEGVSPVGWAVLSVATEDLPLSTDVALSFAIRVGRRRNLSESWCRNDHPAAPQIVAMNKVQRTNCVTGDRERERDARSRRRSLFCSCSEGG